MRKPADIFGFGFNPTESRHHYVVIIPLDEHGTVMIEERFIWGIPSPDEPTRSPSPKALLDDYRWSRIADTVRQQFNKRLRETGLPAAKWACGETLLDDHFGKELVLLAWAIEDIDPSLIPNALSNWLGLQPEERWWLYTTINATSGHPEHGRDRGWRKAIKIAFAENPVPEFRHDTFAADDQYRQVVVQPVVAGNQPVKMLFQAAQPAHAPARKKRKPKADNLNLELPE